MGWVYTKMVWRLHTANYEHTVLWKGNTMEVLELNGERRKQPRLPLSLPLEYRTMYEPRLRTGLLINLNDMGLQFCCRGDLSVGTTLTLRVMFANEYELTGFEVYAKIIWKDLYFERDWREYKYGAEFTCLSEDDKLKLNQLLTTCFSEESLKAHGINSIRDKHTRPTGPQAA